MVEVTPMLPSIASTSLKKYVAKSSRKSIIPTKISHPPTSEMVQSAIFDLRDRHGTSLQAIKKYIFINYSLNREKIAPLIKRYIRSAVSKGKLIQTTGKGASGSFKLPKGYDIEWKTSKTSIKSKNSKNSKTNIKSTKSVAVKKSNVSITKSTSKNAKSATIIKGFKSESKINQKGKGRHVVKKTSIKVKKNTKITGTKPKAPKPKKITSPKRSPKK